MGRGQPAKPIIQTRKSQAKMTPGKPWNSLGRAIPFRGDLKLSGLSNRARGVIRFE